MENTPAKKQEAQDKLNANAYLDGGSLYNYEGFKKSMTISSDNRYYNTLIRHWDETQKNYIKENGLQEVSKGLDLLFSTYLSKIFTIYKHSFNYRENNSVKDMKQIVLKKARFDCLMNEKTDHFISNIENEVVKGKGQLALRRKKYVLGLFTSLESFLVEASINLKKSPFLDIFTTSKEKIQSISFEEIKFLATSTELKPISREQNNLKIAFDIVGENNSRTTSIMFHHIPEVLERYSLSSNEAKNILLTASGGFHPDIQYKIIPKIVEYLKEVGINTGNVAKDLPKNKTLSDLITHQKRESIVSNIKVQYRNIKGKRLKLLLLALKDLKMIPEERVNSKFHALCKKEFNWDIASYTAMNDYVYNPEIDINERNEMKEFLETIINTI